MSSLTAETFKAENFEFKLQKDKEGKPLIKMLSKKGAVRPIIQTPWLIAPFTFSSFARSKAKDSTDPVMDWTVDLKAACYESLDLSGLAKEKYDHARNAELIQILFGELEKLQEMLVDFIFDNSKTLLKKGNWDKSTIETLFLQPLIIKGEPNKETGEIYPYRIRTKVMKKNEKGADGQEGGPDIIIQNFEGNEIPVNSWEDIEKVVLPLIPKGKAMRCFIYLRPYFISASTKIGVSMKLCTIQTDTKKSSYSNTFKFGAIEETAPSASARQEPEVIVVEDSDEEGEDEVDEVDV